MKPRKSAGKKPGRGGLRPGAGRKASGRVAITLRLLPAALAKLKSKSGNRPPGELVEFLLASL
jgi:hypothetical protein